MMDLSRTRAEIFRYVLYRGLVVSVGMQTFCFVMIFAIGYLMKGEVHIANLSKEYLMLYFAAGRQV
jgi:hypothetical protein